MNKIKTLITLVLILITTSCQTERLSPIQLQLLGYSLKKAELPGLGWNVEGKGWSADYGGLSYGITYIIDMHVFVSHTVSMHSSVDRAQKAYEEWETNWFDITNLPPEEPYTPFDQNDHYRFECFQMKPDDPLMDCIYLQQHNQIINFVKINLDSRSASNLTFEQINDILSVLDKRLNEAVIDTNPEATTAP